MGVVAESGLGAVAEPEWVGRGWYTFCRIEQLDMH